MPGENLQDWSVTAANNGSADTSINWAEGQPRASVNNSARSMMAAHAKDRNLHNGSIVTGGSANAQTFFSGLNYTAPIPTGLRVTLKIGPGLTNTAAATLEMDGLGAVAIKDQSGADLTAGALTANAYVDFLYNGTNWILLAALTAPTPPANDDSNKVATTGWVHDEIQSIPGVIDGSSAAAGDVGEFKSADSGSWNTAVGAVGTLAILALEAGEWEVWGVVGVGPGASVAGVFATLLIGTTINAASPALSYHGAYTSMTGEYYNGTTPMRVLLTTPTTHYLTMMNNGASAGGISGGAASARIFARRVR